MTEITRVDADLAKHVIQSACAAPQMFTLDKPTEGRSQSTETVQTALVLRRFWPPTSAAG